MNQLKQDIAINPADLDGEAVRQASLYAYYAEQWRQKEKEANLAKLNLDVYAAALDQKIRDTAAAQGRKLTEAQIDAQVRLNSEWFNRKKAVIELEAEAGQLEAVVRAFVQKKDMLVTLANNQRQERSTLAAMNGLANVAQFPGAVGVRS